MQRFYLVPIETVGSARGPKYFAWRFDPDPPGLASAWSLMDYGFMPSGLIFCPDVIASDHTFLAAQSDVYDFPEVLNVTISDRTAMDAFFEAISIPTDWLTAGSTYLEFLRKMAGMFQFNQRYNGISGGHSIFENGRTLESNWNSLSAQEQSWFLQTSVSFGGPASIPGNPKLRSLTKQAGDLWGETPFLLGGVTF